jgi:hypothetical protein
MSILTPWEPFRELPHEMRRFQREMDRLFGRWGIVLPIRPALAVSYPAVILWEDNDLVYAETELPGLRLSVRGDYRRGREPSGLPRLATGSVGSGRMVTDGIRGDVVS